MNLTVAPIDGSPARGDIIDRFYAARIARRERRPRQEPQRCGVCSKPGHNARTCPEERESRGRRAPLPPAPRKPYRCGICREPGHRQELCPDRRPEPTPPGVERCRICHLTKPCSPSGNCARDIAETATVRRGGGWEGAA